MVTHHKIQEYWDKYATSIQFNGIEWGSPEFFQRVKEDHDKAYAFSNEILNIPAHKGKSVLEICCGIGLDALELAKTGARVTFISPSPKCIELTRKYFTYHDLDATLEVVNAADLSFQANSFDVVIARGILMFTSHPNRLVEEILRILKPGGELYAHLHNRYSWYVILAKISRTNLVYETEDPPVSNLHTVYEAKQVFKDFSSINIFLDRLPSKTSKRSGVLTKLYNSTFVPLVKLIPNPIIRYSGYYIIIKAIK